MRSLIRAALPLLGAAGFALLFTLERRRPLRHRVSDAGVRLVRNSELGAITGAVVGLLSLPAIAATARLVERRRLGLLQRLPLPEPARAAIAVLLLDYTYYWWHRFLHHVPFLWRFHLVHHTDLDLDLSTALRFHVGEWVLSLPFRVAQTIAIGAPRSGVRAFESAMFLGVMFHHSNLRLPFAIERRLLYTMVTPRMHGIHHSINERETDSNFGTLLNVWDRIHRTLLLGVPQGEITIGHPGYRSEAELGLAALLRLPFEPAR